MKQKRRLQNLECQPAKHVDAPKESALQFAIRWREERRKEIAADPEGWERGAKAREQSRQKRLRQLGFLEGHNPTASELLQRIIARRKA